MINYLSGVKMANTRIDYFDRVTLLFNASYSGNVPRLKELLADPNFKALINRGVDTQGNHAPLFFACYGGANAEAVQVLLDNGANALKRDNIGRIPLHLAANSNDPEILEVLLAQPSMNLFVDDAAADTGQTPFHALFLPGSGNGPAAKAANGNLADCLKKLLAKSPNPFKSLNTPDKNGLTPLILAYHFNLLAAFDNLDPSLKSEINQYIVKIPANIKELLKVDFYGRTELLEAAFVSHDNNAGGKANKEIIRKAIADGADLMVVNKQSGRNALQLACFGLSDGETVKMLLDAPQTKVFSEYPTVIADHKGRTFAHFAANTGRIDTNAVIWKHKKVSEFYGDFLKATDAMGRTVLHAAAMAASRTTLSEEEKAAGETLSQREKVIDLLFAEEIDETMVDKNGQTALQIAEERGNTVVAARIKHNIALRAAQSLPEGLLPAFSKASVGTPLAALSAPPLSGTLPPGVVEMVNKLNNKPV